MSEFTPDPLVAQRRRDHVAQVDGFHRTLEARQASTARALEAATAGVSIAVDRTPEEVAELRERLRRLEERRERRQPD